MTTKSTPGAPPSPSPPPASCRRRQGRILRLHFACSAPLPHGSTLRVTSSIAPPPKNDVPDSDEHGGGCDSSVMSGDIGFGEIGGSAYGMAAGGGGGHVGDGGIDEARRHNRLLQNTATMYTTPEMYPIWRTRKPVVVIDGRDAWGGGEGHDDRGSKMRLAKSLEAPEDCEEDLTPLLHRYRYLAVTPGATADWSKLNDDGSASTRGNQTDATTPPESEDDEPEGAGLAAEEQEEAPAAEDEEDAVEDLPPVLFEDPTPEDPASAPAKGAHRRLPSLFDSQGNPVVLPGSSNAAEASYSSMGTSVESFSALARDCKKASPVTWEKVGALPYRTRTVVSSLSGTSIDEVSAEGDVKVVDVWNDKDDATFANYWATKKSEEEAKREAILKAATPPTLDTSTEPESPGADVPSLNCDDDPTDHKESIYIVCYHLPVILSRDADTAQWNACWSESLIAKSTLDGVSSTRRTTWIGTVSNIAQDLLQDPQEREAIRRILAEMDCLPVFFDHDEGGTDGGGEGGVLDNMYLGFCKQVLWPSFHNVDLLDLATCGWGSRQRTTTRGDPVMACALAAAAAKQRRTAGGEGAPQPESRPSDWDQRRLDNWWNAYIRVNLRFSEVVAGLVEGGDVVWVHDYHLALLPRMLREARGEAHVVHDVAGAAGAGRRTFLPPKEAVGGEGLPGEMRAAVEENVRPVRMVFFIHVPFPTSQVFRELEHGEALLEGMLHADVVGFHAFDHARHFLNAAKRILGLTYESLAGGLIGVRHRGTRVLVTVSNVSVEADIIDALQGFPSVQEEAAALRRKHGDRRIIAGIAVTQRLSGVSYKLLAFERLLADYPVWQSQVVLLQRCLIPGARRVDEADTLREVRLLVRRIRDRFGPEVIDYEEQVGSVLPIDQRLAIWDVASICMHTPIREGLNLCPLEYVYARKEPADPGVVIASEFAAVSSILNGALRVNPYDVQMCVATIDTALSMTFNERDARRGRDIDFVATCPSGRWTGNVLRDLHDATLGGGGGGGPSHALGDAKAGGPSDVAPAREAESGPERLDLVALERAYLQTQTSRVIIIDFNGTLVVKEPAGKYLKREILGTSGFKPSQLTMLALQRMCANPLNTVYVVSGDSQQNLEVAVGNVPGLGLAASNGTCFADPQGIGENKRNWQYLDFGVDWNAVKKVAMPIISKFTARTNGSFVKLSHSSIGWSYYSCDPEWGSLQASHLVTELGEALHSHDVRFVALKGIVEVVPRKGHKGHIVKKILEDARTRSKNVDFVLCMGDDISDEKMFTSVINFSSGSNGKDSYAFNVAVGKKSTNASFYVDDASDVGEILVALSGDEKLVRRQTATDGSAGSLEDFFT